MVITDADYVPTASDYAASAPKRPRELQLHVTDYKGDLPLNPVPWIRLAMVEKTPTKNGRINERVMTITLDAKTRAALLQYLTGSD